MAREPETGLTDGQGAPARARFHHGNLRAAALDAALRLVQAGGAEALSLRDVAKETGVNHRALYRHFADRDDLIAAVAAAGFERLRGRMAEAFAAAGGPGRAAMLGAYVAFAVGEPRLYTLMFGMGGPAFLTHPILGPAVGEVTRLAAEAFRTPDDPPGFSLALRDRVMLAWGTAHGLCDLWFRGALRARGPEEVLGYILGLLGAECPS